MIQRRYLADAGLTGLDLVIFIVVLIIVTVILLVHLGGGTPLVWHGHFPAVS
jgi:hypothetical protein